MTDDWDLLLSVVEMVMKKFKCLDSFQKITNSREDEMG